MSLVTLEFHFSNNWSHEGEAVVYYCGDSEQEYGRVVQGATYTQQTYVGHRWRVREARSRVILHEVVAQPASTVTIVEVGAAPPAHDPLRAALWRMGKAPREPLVKAAATLTKLLENAKRDDPKYRSVRVSNPAIASVLDGVPGALALLVAAGWEQLNAGSADAEARLVLRAAYGPLDDALLELKRLHALMHGLPPPGAPAAPPPPPPSAAASSSSDAADASHRCGHCRRGIQNDLRQQMRRGSSQIDGWRTHDYIGGGEFRFHCERCKVDLCDKCYDKWKGGDAAVHPQACQLSIEAPITTPWGSSGYGAPPAPPPFKGRRGPFGR